MFDPNGRRFAGTAAIVFVAVWLVAFLAFIPSGLPNSGDSAGKVLSYFGEHRGALLTSAYLQGFAILPFFAFTAAVVTMMRRTSGGEGWSVMTAMSGAAAGATAIVSIGFGAVLAYRGAAGDAGLARTMLDANAMMFALSGFPLAVFVFSASQGMASADLVGRWVVPVGTLAALIQLVAAAAFAKGDGFMSPQGPMSYVGVIAFLVWGLVVGIALEREHATMAATHPPAAPLPA